jgi:hypothetical protein
MYGFWRLGLRPAPSAGAAITSNGLETATSSQAKPSAIPPSTGVTQTTRSRARLRASQTASAAYPLSTSSQRSSDPSCPPQNADSLYGVGSALLECPATYASEKSSRAKPATSTSAATSVEKNAAISAFRAECARRRFPSHAAAPPATSAYAESPRVTRSAARPSSATAQLGVSAAWYFDGHLVIIVPGFDTNTPSARCVPVTTRSRPVRNMSGTEPV